MSLKNNLPKLREERNTPTVIIKATDDATYNNLIDALDEMQICNIGKYVITDIEDGDKVMIGNLMQKNGEPLP